MMPQFTLSNRALADLKDIGRFTLKEWGRDQRNIYLSMLDGVFHQLAIDPMKGRDCGDIRKDYRKQIAGSHVIFYRVLPDKTVEIVRILHGSMDIEVRLIES